MIVHLDGQKVRAMREELWMSREEFAKISGVGKSTLFNVEHDVTPVRPKTAHKIAKVLGVDAKSLASPLAGCASRPKEPVETLREGAVA